MWFSCKNRFLFPNHSTHDSLWLAITFFRGVLSPEQWLAEMGKQGIQILPILTVAAKQHTASLKSLV
jgi:hypothetical protein